MESKFEIGDEVILVVPCKRQVDPDFMEYMQPAVGKVFTVLKKEFYNSPWNDLPPWCYEVNLFGKPEYIHEDWFDLADKTEVSLDKEQLTSLL